MPQPHHYTHHDLVKHLKEEHKMSPFSTYLQEIVYGGNDGIVTTFAVVAGFAGAGAAEIGGIGYTAVLLFGIANLMADGVSMGLGNLLSVRAERDLYIKERNKEEIEIENNPGIEKAETFELLKSRGFSESECNTLIRIYSSNKEYWADFMMRYELEMTDTRHENPWFKGIATFLSFVAFGSIPLIPYVLFPSSNDSFLLATSFTFLALLLLGFLRWKVTGHSVFRSVGEIILIGGLSSTVAFVVGTFFRA